MLSGKVHELTAVFKRSDEYNRYQRVRAELERNTELKRQIDAFRSEKYRMQQFGSDMYNASDELRARYRYLLTEPLVTEFLELENTICKMIREICDEIIQDIPMDLPDIG